MRLRILHLEPECYPESLLERLREVGTLDLLEGPGPDALAERLRSRSYGAIFLRLGCQIDASVLDLQPKLRFLITPTTGLNHIDLEAAEHRGVRIVSLRGETEFLNTVRSTAEHTWALLLALVRRLPSHAARVRQGRWERSGWMAAELDGATLGIIGFGRLGRMVAGYGDAFGMRVLAYDRDAGSVALHPTVRSRPLQELLATSDVVSLHITGSDENTGFLNAERLRSMKPGALLINTARGEVVDEPALLDVLERGHLGGAALDVLAGDSAWSSTVPTAHPLVEYARENDNLIITPHIGGYGRTSIRRTREFVTSRFLELCRAPATL